jgi:tetratricopeptide (TPR) repeat protein
MFVDFGSMPQEQMTFQQQFNQQFHEGLALQQEKKWDDALGKYQSLLDQGQGSLTNEQGSVIYHNMAAISYEKADYLKAYIWVKKSLALNSDNTIAKNLSAEVAKKYQPVQIPHQISTVETLQNVTLKDVSIDFLLIGFLLFFAVAIYLALKALLANKKNQIESESLSQEKKNSVGLIISFLSFLTISAVFLFFVVIKWTDFSVPKAIITADNTSVQTASGGNQASIFDASAGLEVDVLKVEPEYVQIRYPGAFSGWVSKKNIEILSSPSWSK